MMTMVERVARAIIEATSGTWDAHSISAQQVALREARAAIEAMREPTTGSYDSMDARGGYHCIQGAGPVSERDKAQARAVWSVMIDAALSGGA